jgi:hypothetical protein
VGAIKTQIRFNLLNCESVKDGHIASEMNFHVHRTRGNVRMGRTRRPSKLHRHYHKILLAASVRVSIDAYCRLTQVLGCKGLNARMFAQTSIPKTGQARIAPTGGEMMSLLKGKSSGKGVYEVCNDVDRVVEDWRCGSSGRY